MKSLVLMSVAARIGLFLPISGKMLGHTQAATTQRYAHLAADPIKEAVDRVGAAIAAVMHGEGHGRARAMLPADTTSRSC